VYNTEHWSIVPDEPLQYIYKQQFPIFICFILIEFLMHYKKLQLTCLLINKLGRYIKLQLWFWLYFFSEATYESFPLSYNKN
jgi:hypothetical protein